MPLRSVQLHRCTSLAVQGSPPKILVQSEPCKQWLNDAGLAALSPSRGPSANRRRASPGYSRKCIGRPFIPPPSSRSPSQEILVTAARLIFSRLGHFSCDWFGRDVYFCFSVDDSAGTPGKLGKITRRKRMIHSGRTRLEKKVSRVGVGGGGQVGQGVQPVEESGASGQWWRQQHPSYHHHHHHQHHHHYHHQAGYYTLPSHTHNNPVTTMKQSYMQLTWVFHDDEAQINKKLPKELLLRILSYLDVVSLCRCAQVSKAWNVLALDGSNWQRIDLFDFQRDVEGPVIENISRRCGGFLRQLSLRGCQSIGNNSMRTLAQSCPNIEELNLSQCKKISDATCAALSSHCPKLQRLNLDSCPEITDIALKDLSDGCPLLTHINLSWCKLLTDNGVEALARGCPELRSFLCKGCRQLTNKAVKCLARFCQNLEAINLHECRNITDDAVKELSEQCPRLHYVCLSNCPNLTDVSLLTLAQHCPLLSVLECVACTHFTDAGFQALAKNCRLLEKMDLEECLLITDATLIHLAMGCPRLEKLSLSHCELITDEGIRQLALSPCAAEHLAVLELDNCPLITDASLDHLLQACHNLERIELYDCQLITRAGIRRLRTHLPNIKVHAYFAPVTPPPSAGASRQRYCRCCVIL
ncbi:F-box/LRR-repeat protein 2 isoform X1 [Megalopta genalis]|uniref:F-box/LRR-repeat protein 2 isoform X1 n=1 Tax=Megalopta genalis TaxID=115081 RepID=UPI003FD388E2